MRGEGHPHGLDHLAEQLGRGGRARVQQGVLGVAVVPGVVVDAQVHMTGELRHPVVLAKKLDARHIHRNHQRGFKLPFVQMQVQVRILRGDRIGAEHPCRPVQRPQRIVQSAAAAQSIPIRVFMTQNQNVVRSQQALGHLLHSQLFCHATIPSFPLRRSCYSASPVSG